MDLFDRHYATHFVPDWEEDIPDFTPDDWYEFLILSYGLWTYDLLQSEGISPDWAGDFLEKHKDFLSGFKPDGDLSARVKAAYTRMVSPLDPAAFEAASSEDDQINLVISIAYQGWLEKTRQNFYRGLACAIQSDLKVRQLCDFLPRPNMPGWGSSFDPA